MRRLSLCFLFLAPMLAFSCAQGNTLGRFGEYGRGAGDPGENEDFGNDENDNEPDPGSSDPGQGGGDPGGQMGGQAPGDTGEECAHDPCTPGAPLDENCDPCVAATCAADAFCCEGEWDDTCVANATSCGCELGGAGGAPGIGGSDPGGDPGIGGSDPGGDPGGDPTGGVCAHELCETGEPLDPSCDPCADAVCQVDPYCCEVEWDAFCLAPLIEACPLACF